MIGPPGLMGRRVLALLLGIRGEETERGPPGARPKLEGEGEGEGFIPSDGYSS